MAYSQEQINAAYSDLIAQGYAADVAEAYLRGVVAADQAAPVSDPRLDEMYADWQQNKQLTAYDQTIEQIVAANPDVDSNAFHVFVAAAEGNFDKAVSMYRADRAQILSDHGLQRVPQPGPAAMDYSAARAAGHMTAQDELHRRIEEATAWAKRH